MKGRSPSSTKSPPDFRPFLESVLSELSLALDKYQLDLLVRHFELLQKWNARMSLTSILAPEEIAVRHFGESLFVAKFLTGPGRVADVGSGAGFPGFPLAVARPGLHVTLAESRQRKAAFLKEVSRDVPNVRVYAGRFEDLQESFDWVTLRAVNWKKDLPLICVKSPRIALLTMGKDALNISSFAETFSWTRHSLPSVWGRDSVLVIGERRIGA